MGAFLRLTVVFQDLWSTYGSVAGTFYFNMFTNYVNGLNTVLVKKLDFFPAFFIFLHILYESGSFFPSLGNFLMS